MRLSVHLVLRWGATVLRATRLSPPRGFALGDGGDWMLPAGALGAPRLELLGVRDGRVFLSPHPGAPRAPVILREGSRERVQLGALRIDVEVDRVAAVSGVAWRPALGSLRHPLASAALHALLLGALRGFAPSAASGSIDATEAREGIALMTGLLARSDAQDGRPRDPHVDGDLQATGSRDDARTPGGAGRPAQSEEGALGSAVARTARGRVGVLGPHDAIDPRLARESEPIEMIWDRIGMDRVPMPDPDAPVAPWGRVLSHGTEEASARAPMWGGAIEDALGLGGLGLSGTGEGGGFHAAAIGLGDPRLGEGAGTGSSGMSGLGHGYGACGCGEGISEGHGRLGGSHVVRPARLRTAAVTVRGRLPAEAIQRVVRANEGRFRACYERGLDRQPGLRGRVATKLVIARDGSVPVAVDAGSDLPDGAVVSCIARAFESLSFPPPEDGVVTVVYPFSLAPD
jgi:hypothetical protein